MIRPMYDFVGGGGWVKVGGGVGSSRSKGWSRMVKLTGLVGMNRHKPIARATRNKPTGIRNRGAVLRREKIRRLDMLKFYIRRGCSVPALNSPSGRGRGGRHEGAFQVLQMVGLPLRAIELKPDLMEIRLRSEERRVGKECRSR